MYSSDGNYLFVNKKNEPLALFIRDVPEELCLVMNFLQGIFPDMFKETDTRAPGYKFHCFHFDWYNRYPERVSPSFYAFFDLTNFC